ncbi:MAG: ImcF-related family protein [Pseudomonadota bacterium]
MSATLYGRAGTDLQGLIDNIDLAARAGERGLAERAAVLLDEYTQKLTAAGAPGVTIAPARLSYAVMIDRVARAEPELSTSAWLAAAHTRLFDRREVTVDTLRNFRDIAQNQGPEYSDLARHLDWVLAELEQSRRHRTRVSRRPAILVALASIALLVGLGAYALYLDYRYHAVVLRAFTDEIDAIELGGIPRLDRLSEAAGRVTSASAAAPLANAVSIPMWTSGPVAEAHLRDEVAAILPATLREAIANSVASEGNPVALYDTLRAWAILTGQADWQPAFLAGWAEDRGAVFAPHIRHLSGPSPHLVLPDAELLAQATEIAAETSEPERAYLELMRLSVIRNLPRWRPSRVEGLSIVMVLRSGSDLSEGIAGIFTADGWRAAERGAINDAIAIARQEARAILPTPVMENDTARQVEARLQRETLRRWQSWLADLRVRPFTQAELALEVSGALARRSSPLGGLFEEVWLQVGGGDQSRPAPLRDMIETDLGRVIDYVRSGELDDIRALFASLNRALATLVLDDEAGAERLMDVRERAESVAALRDAPQLIVQITEDVLAQTSASHASLLTNPLTRQWQVHVFPACEALEDTYPFDPDGENADLSAFVALFGPAGALQSFYRESAAPYLDDSAEVWRWAPDARFSGVEQESAVFLQDALLLSDAFFSPDGGLGQSFLAASLGQRGEATFSVGGALLPLGARAGEGQLAWPGAAPEEGAELLIGEAGQLSELGPWGLFRLLDATVVRPRDEGRRHRIDFRTPQGRLFLEIEFESPLNPVSARPLLEGFSCPPTL